MDNKTKKVIFRKEPAIPKALIGRQFTDFDGDKWELTGKNDLNVPYFSKVVKGKTQKKQYTHMSGLRQIEEWKKQEVKKFRKEHSTHIPSKQVKKVKTKEIKLKSFSIGQGNSKFNFKNINRVKKKNIPTYYTVDVNRGNNIIHRQLKIASNNKQELRKGLEKMYPKKVRLMHHKIYGKKK